MTRHDSAGRYVALLEMMLGTLPPCTSEEEHRKAVTRLLDFYERLHAGFAVQAPGWITLGRERFPHA
jgi:polynucleotide 5'-kinase involved in rRNA processing